MHVLNTTWSFTAKKILYFPQLDKIDFLTYLEYTEIFSIDVFILGPVHTSNKQRRINKKKTTSTKILLLQFNQKERGPYITSKKQCLLNKKKRTSTKRTERIKYKKEITSNEKISMMSHFKERTHKVLKGNNVKWQNKYDVPF